MAKTVSKYVNQKLGVEIPLKLDTKTGRFEATVMGTRIEATSLDALRKDVDKLIQGSINLVWYPIIQIADLDRGHRHYYDHDRSSFQFSADRLYLARHPASGIVKCRWDVERTTANSQSYHCDIDVPIQEPLRESGTMWLPYSDETWKALERLGSAVGTLYKQFPLMLTSGAEASANNLAEAIEALLPVPGKMDDGENSD